MLSSPYMTELMTGARPALGFGVFAFLVFSWIGYVEAVIGTKRWILPIIALAAIFVFVGVSKDNTIGMLGFFLVIVCAALLGVATGTKMQSYFQSKNSNGATS